MLINTQAKSDTAQKILRDIDLTIEQAYTDIEESVNDILITDTQDVIDKLNIIRVGLFNEIVKFSLSNRPSKQMESYVVREDVLLTDISLLYYGNQDYWQYIYDYNQLTDINLEINTILIIPELPNDPEDTLHWNDIIDAEIINKLIELEEIDI